MVVQRKQIGQQELIQENDWLVVVRLHSEITGPEAAEIVDTMMAWTPGWKTLGLVLDIQKMTGISPAARRVMYSKKPPPDMYQLYAHVGTSFTIRVIASMGMRAWSVLHRQEPRVLFAATEEEARNWLFEMRQQYLDEQQGSGRVTAP